MCDPPVASAGLGKDSEAWIRRRWRFCRLWPPVSGVPHAKVAYVSYLPAQTKGRVVVRLTEGLWLPELLRRAAGVEDGRRRRRSSVAGHCGGAPSVWTPWFDSRQGCEGAAGVRVVRGSPAAWKSRRQSHLPAMRPWRNSRCGVTRSGARELEELPESQAEMLWPWAGARRHRGG